MEQEILDYMKYGLAGILWESMTEGEAKEVRGDIKNAASVNRVSDLYEEHRQRSSLPLKKPLKN